MVPLVLFFRPLAPFFLVLSLVPLFGFQHPSSTPISPSVPRSPPIALRPRPSPCSDLRSLFSTLCSASVPCTLIRQHSLEPARSSFAVTITSMRMTYQAALSALLNHHSVGQSIGHQCCGGWHRSPPTVAMTSVASYGGDDISANGYFGELSSCIYIPLLLP